MKRKVIILNNNKFYLLIVIFLVISRVLFLDQDVPLYTISGITQLDEVYYSLNALNHYNFETDNYIESFEKTPRAGMGAINSALTYCSYHIFGKTYYGLRMSAVFISFLTILLLFNIFKKHSGNNKKIYFGLLVFLMTDFYFFLFSRFETPQIYSIFVITLILWIINKLKMTKEGLFLAGFVAMFAIFVYIYNIFALLGVAMFFLIKAIKEKRLKYIIYPSLGVISSFLLFNLILLILKSNFIEYINGFLEFGSNRNETIFGKDYSIKSFTYSSFMQIVSILKTNLFRYNPFLLFFSIGSVITIFISIYKKKKVNDLFLLAFIMLIFAFIQVVFINSYPFKKWIVLLPIAYVLALYFFISVKQKNIIILAFMFTFIITLYSYYIYYAKDFSFHAAQYGIYEKLSKILALLVIIIFLFSFLAFYLKKKKNIFIPFMILPGIILTLNIVFINQNYTIRDGLQSLNYKMKDKVIVAGFSHPVSLYTEATPVLNPYEYYGKTDKYYKTMDSLFTVGIGDYYVEIALYKDKKMVKLKIDDIYKKGDNYNLVLDEKINTSLYYSLYFYKRVNPNE